jgi:hypothetical protein
MDTELNTEDGSDAFDFMNGAYEDETDSGPTVIEGEGTDIVDTLPSDSDSDSGSDDDTRTIGGQTYTSNGDGTYTGEDGHGYTSDFLDALEDKLEHPSAVPFDPTEDIKGGSLDTQLGYENGSEAYDFMNSATEDEEEVNDNGDTSSNSDITERGYTPQQMLIAAEKENLSKDAREELYNYLYDKGLISEDDYNWVSKKSNTDPNLSTVMKTHGYSNKDTNATDLKDTYNMGMKEQSNSVVSDAMKKVILYQPYVRRAVKVWKE